MLRNLRTFREDSSFQRKETPCCEVTKLRKNNWLRGNVLARQNIPITTNGISDACMVCLPIWLKSIVNVGKYTIHGTYVQTRVSMEVSDDL